MDSQRETDSLKQPTVAVGCPEDKHSAEDKEVEKKRKAELEEKIRQRVACEERAFRIVQKLVENTVTGDYLKDVAAYIDQSHYDDIVEERSISLICGYPICGKQLTKVPKQKYRICTKTNRVYDITDSKRYCSSSCYKSSQYYMNQVPTSPVWSRKGEAKPCITLLDKTDKVKHLQGAVVLQDPRMLVKEELEELDRMDQQSGNAETKETVNSQGENAEMELPEIFENISENVDQGDTENVDQRETGKNVDQGETGNADQGDTEKADQGDTENVDQRATGNVDQGDTENVDQRATGNVDQGDTENVDQRATGNVDQGRTDNVDQRETWNVDQGGIENVDQGTNRNNTDIEIENKETTPDKDMSSSTVHQQSVGSRLHQPYCQRSPDQQSQGYVNRATYYGYDEAQQALKAQLNREIVTADGSNMRAKIQNVVPSEVNKNWGVGSIQKSGNRSDSGASMTNPLYIETENAYKQQNVHKPNSLDTLVKESTLMKHNTHRGTVVEESTVVNTLPSTGSTQSKIDRLMGLLDKRDSLKEQLQHSQGNTSYSKDSKRSSTSNQVHQTESNVTGKSRTDKSNQSSFSPVKSEVLPSKADKSSRVLKNIERASRQQQGCVDSDDDELDEDDVELKSPDKLASQMEKLSVRERSAVTTASVTPLALIRKVLSEWRTEDTVTYIKGGKAVPNSTESTRQKHTALSRKVEAQIRQYSHLLDGDDDHKEPSKPLPSMSDLTNDPYAVKVGEFYSAGSRQKKKDKPGYVVEPVESTDGKKKKKLFDHEVEEDLGYDRSEYISEKDVRLPYVDSQSKIALRRKIVLDKLTRVLSDMLGAARLSMRDISAELRTLVHTFNLSSENIVLKAGEWTLMGYCLLTILSYKMKSVRKSIKQEHSVQFFTTVLHSFGVTATQLKDMVDAILS